MVSLVPTTPLVYKVGRFSPEGNSFMDQGRSQQSRVTTQATSSLKHPAPLTDPTALQSLLPLCPLPSQPPLDLRLPETRPPRKRKASHLDDSTMSQPPYQRYRRDDPVPPPTIDPTSLTTPFTPPTQYFPEPYGPLPTSTAPYGTWPPMQHARTSSAPYESIPNQYGYHHWDSMSSDPSVPSQPASHRSSVTSTASQQLGFTASMPPSFQQSPYPPNAYSPQPVPSPYPGAGPYTGVLPHSTYPATTQHSPMHPISGMVSTSRPEFEGPRGPPGASPQQPAEARRPRPQCWDHGCNGREFSTFSNLLRHQRERSGTAPRSYCPRCGAEFTRSTARTNHLINSKCKHRHSSN